MTNRSMSGRLETFRLPYLSSCRRLALVALVASLTTGCVLTRANVTPYNSFAPVPTDSVEVFTERAPQRDFEEVGLIEVVGNAFASYGDLVTRARREAGTLGASAILVSRRPINSASAFVGLGAVTVVEQEAPRIWVIAITWKR